MTIEPLPEDSKILLSLIRSHPGIDMWAAMKETGFDLSRYRFALAPLNGRFLVKVKVVSSDSLEKFKFYLFAE